MASAALLQTGCRSGGFFSPCGFVGRTTSRILQPFRHGSGASPCGVVSDGCFGSEVSSDVPMEYAAPVGVVGPGVPIGPGAAVIEGGSVPSTVSPPGDSPTNLEPLPRAETGPSPSRGGRGSTNSGVRTPSNYDAQRPSGASRHVDKPSHTLVSSPASVSRPSHDAIQTSAKSETAGSGDDDNVLDHLPPLDLPADVTGRGDSPPIAPAAVKPRAAAAVSTSAPASPATSALPATNDQLTGRSAREVGAALVVADATPATAAAKAGDAIGISRFVAVDLKLAGGAAPSAVGLGWLAEKGYRTILDLRSSSQAEPAFIGEAAERGLRYVAFPVDLEKLDRDRLDRFNFELSINDARPLYFFDEDGRRAGALWYLRRILADKVSPDIARREAQELGLIDAASWKLVQNAVDAHLTPRPPAPVAATGDDHPPAANPKTPSPTPPVTAPTAPASTPSTPTTAPRADLPSIAPTPVADSTRPLANIALAALGDDPDAWQPIAAMVLTGLTFPLAYFSRAVIPTMLARTRASLPGPARQSKSLPPASGA